MRSVFIALGVHVFIRHVTALMRIPFGNGTQSIALRQELQNLGDTAYTGTLMVGGQELQTIFDTGSFELVVLSKDCAHCGRRESLFDSQKSSTFSEVNNLTAVNTYGSGTAYTTSAYDDVSLEGLQGSHQFFWKVYDVDEALRELFGNNLFAAISGVGPSKSALTFAEYELQSVRREVTQYIQYGGTMTSDMDELLKSFEAKVKLAKTSKTILDTLKIYDMSVCLGRTSGSSGYFTWNDKLAQERPALFLEIPVVGDIYWSAELTDVRFGPLPQLMVGSTTLGCDMQRCSAVIDTGTTLIAAPSKVAYAIDDFVTDWERSGGSCEDLSLLPHLVFSLGGKVFTLPPEAYMAQYSGTDSSLEQAKSLLPHLYRRHVDARKQREAEAESYTYCASTITPMDADSQFGPLWILGMSFFREYYTSFHLLPEGESLKGSSMLMSVAGPDCRPVQSPSGSSEQLTSEAKVDVRKAQLKLDVSKIRSSSLADRVHRMATPRIPEFGNVRQSLSQTKAPIVRI